MMSLTNDRDSGKDSKMIWDNQESKLHKLKIYFGTKFRFLPGSLNIKRIQYVFTSKGKHDEENATKSPNRK